MSERKDVRVVARKNKSALVEWADADGFHRGFVPDTAVDVSGGSRVTASVSESDLGMALPYGVPWADVVTLELSMKEMEQALHNRGIWTAQDVRENHRAAVAAIGYAYSANIRSLIEAAESYETTV